MDGKRILRGDRVKVPVARKAGVLRVGAIHQDVTFTGAMTEAVRAEIEDLARWLGLDLSSPR